MKRPAALFPIALALGATSLVPGAGANVPTPITICQTINQPGSYVLANNLTFTGPAGGTCLSITANNVTIDLAGFAIDGDNGGVPFAGAAIADLTGALQGIAVRNGSISNFSEGVILGTQGETGNSIVEGLRVSGQGNVTGGIGIMASGIVKGNAVISMPAAGIVATGTVTGNIVSNSGQGFDVGRGSTVIGNTALNNLGQGFVVSCPSNVTDNTAVGNGTVPPVLPGDPNLFLMGDGCNATNNVPNVLP
jgi:hypothetical protein